MTYSHCIPNATETFQVELGQDNFGFNETEIHHFFEKFKRRCIPYITRVFDIHFKSSISFIQKTEEGLYRTYTVPSLMLTNNQEFGTIHNINIGHLNSWKDFGSSSSYRKRK